MRSSISFLLLAPDAWARGCGPWFTLPSVACPVGSVALVLSLRIFFVKYLLSSWYCGLALRLRSLLRGSCFGTVVPWGLASFYRVCGGYAGLVLPGPARLVGSLLQSWCLVLGPGCLVCRLPSVSFPWVGSTVGFFGFRLHFLGISRSVFGYV